MRAAAGLERLLAYRQRSSRPVFFTAFLGCFNYNLPLQTSPSRRPVGVSYLRSSHSPEMYYGYNLQGEIGRT